MITRIKKIMVERGKINGTVTEKNKVNMNRDTAIAFLKPIS